ncbi:hypothetical protein CH35J_006876 [Colletotrichum higginsianum]|uniref:Uncharacterized protein n=1 Tax=Colletotrichum higginsianum TaxID=80884 RepID=A0A4T0VXD2_9PEZI|nr:hypothetical protein CH35J_006876 [Colletotrichum higginsianum]
MGTDEGPDSVGSTGSRASRKRAVSIDIEEANSSRGREFSLETGPMGSEGGKDYICLCTPALKVPRPRNGKSHALCSFLVKFGLWSWSQTGSETGLDDLSPLSDAPNRQLDTLTRKSAEPLVRGRFGTVSQVRRQVHRNAENAINAVRDADGGKIHGLRDAEEDYEPMSPSPELKRRRFNGMGHYQAVPSPGPYTGHPLSRQPRSSLSMPPTPPVAGYGPLPGPSSLARTGHGNMAPPPRPHHPAYTGPSRGPGFDESLRLPPLQTQTSPPLNRDNDANDRPSAHPAAGLGITNPRDSYAQSLEAMIMTIPFLSKLKVLQKISPTLAPPGPISPDIEIRGAVIAVEGADPRQLEQVGMAVHRSLLGLGEIDLKTWTDGPITPMSILPAEEDARMNDTASVGSSRKSSHSQSSTQTSELFSNYMQTMMKWHEKSREIVRHVSTRQGLGADAPPLARRASDGEMVGSRHSSVSATGKTPIALLPAGFSLTISDKYACMIPIADSYAPVDHWQWMSTLWRGIVGPDLVIYVKSVAEDEVTRGGAVEFRGSGVMVVRIAHNKSLDEKTERRISFEVVEWIRGGSYQEGFGRGLI